VGWVIHRNYREWLPSFTVYYEAHASMFVRKLSCHVHFAGVPCDDYTSLDSPLVAQCCFVITFTAGSSWPLH